MQPVTILAEVLFVVLFLVTFREYLIRRDPVSRDVCLVFSALALLLVVELLNRFGAGAPPVVSIVAGVLFVFQPVFALRLVSHVRDVPRAVIVTAAVLSVVSVLPVLVIPGLRTTGAVVALLVFVAIESTAAAYFVAASRTRSGPSAGRLVLAALSTGLLAAALLFALAGAAAPVAADVTRALASIVALLAAVGYVVAFIPPRSLRRFWQAGTTVDYGRRLIAVAGEPVEQIWRCLSELAAGVAGGSAAVIVRSGGNASLVATTGIDLPAESRDIALDDLDGLLGAVAANRGTAVQDAGPLVQRLAASSGSRFVSVVALVTPRPDTTASVVLLSRHRSLFHSSDLELLATLGVQTAIVAERREVLAEQEALTRTLEQTVEALRAASEAKSDFLASMSHELRTPLSAILGFSDLMRREPADGTDVTVPLEWVEHIHRGGEHLLALINDVLDLAKVEAGRLELHTEPIDLGGMAVEVVSGLRPLADRKHLSLVSAVPSLTVVADRGRLRQILYNLVSNAIKYTPDGGSVRIEAAAEGGEARIDVIDTGIGIAPEDHVTVFEEFRQVGDPLAGQSGTGLGLALTRRLIEAHKGRIELVSALGAGSRFTIVIPIGTPEGSEVPRVAPSASSAAVAGSNGVQPDVLVIEDDPSVIRLLRQYLEPSGYRLRVAPTGEAGLDAMRTEPPAAVILDVLLPGMDGWEVLRLAKADARLREVPVVILTVVDEREVGLALGAVDYLVKPVERDALMGVLGRYTFTTKLEKGTVRVLAVDDEPAALELIRSALEPEGFEVVLAGGGREALDQVASGDFDLVVCDLIMPDIDGFEVVAKLKADPRTAVIPILVCTAHELSDADKLRLNGKILGIVAKGAAARDGLRAWLGVAVAGSGRVVEPATSG